MNPPGRLATVLLMATQVALVAIILVRFPAHLADVDWPAHAKAHLVAQIGTTLALGVLGLAVLAGPFRGGQRWAWWCLALVGLAVFGGYWFARAMVEPEAPWRGGNTTFAILTGSHFVGLALGWPSFFRREN